MSMNWYRRTSRRPILQTEPLPVDFATDHGWTRVADEIDLPIPAGRLSVSQETPVRQGGDSSCVRGDYCP